MIRKSRPLDFDAIYAVINDAALAYKGVIPADRWHEPYMTRTELQEQIDAGVTFSCYCEDERVLGVMGIQDKQDVFRYGTPMFLLLAGTRGIGTRLLNADTRLAKTCSDRNLESCDVGNRFLSQEWVQTRFGRGQGNPVAKVLEYP